MKMIKAGAFFCCFIWLAIISPHSNEARAESFDESMRLSAKCSSRGEDSKACTDFAKWVVKNPEKSEKMKTYCLRGQQGNQTCQNAFSGFIVAHDQITALKFANKEMASYSRRCENGNGKSCWLLAQGYEYKDQPSKRFAALVKGCDLQNTTACGAGVELYRTANMVSKSQFSNFVDGVCKMDSDDCHSRSIKAYNFYRASMREGEASERYATYTRLLTIGACEAVGKSRACLWAANMVFRGEGGPVNKGEAARLFGINCDNTGMAGGCVMSVRAEIENDGAVRPNKKEKYIRRLDIACKSRHKPSCDMLDQIRGT